jgi:hypothetical protein
MSGEFMVSVLHSDRSQGGYFVKPSTLVYELKERIADRMDYDPSEFYLSVSGARGKQERLENSKTLEHYEINEDSVLRVVIDLKKPLTKL